jgi:hypothetical protein
VTLEQVLGLATRAEVADMVALTDAARRVLVPALAARGAPCYTGPRFAGGAEVGGADADVIAGGLLLELKAGLGDLHRNIRYGSLRQRTIHELLGYLLLDYDDAYGIEALGVYAARYAHLSIWPRGELLEELAGRRLILSCRRSRNSPPVGV